MSDNEEKITTDIVDQIADDVDNVDIGVEAEPEVVEDPPKSILKPKRTQKQKDAFARCQSARKNKIEEREKNHP